MEAVEHLPEFVPDEERDAFDERMGHLGIYFDGIGYKAPHTLKDIRNRVRKLLKQVVFEDHTIKARVTKSLFTEIGRDRYNNLSDGEDIYTVELLFKIEAAMEWLTRVLRDFPRLKYDWKERYSAIESASGECWEPPGFSISPEESRSVRPRTVGS